MTVEFNDVGRFKKSWTKELTELTFAALANAVSDGAGLSPDELVFVWQDNGEDGLIFNGPRVVGRVRVIGGPARTS